MRKFVEQVYDEDLKNDGTFIVPKGFHINDRTFYLNCMGLKRVIFQEPAYGGLFNIWGPGYFKLTPNLREVIFLPESLVQIPLSIFAGCRSCHIDIYTPEYDVKAMKDAFEHIKKYRPSEFDLERISVLPLEAHKDYDKLVKTKSPDEGKGGK